MAMLRYIVLLAALILSGCAQQNHSQKLLSNIETHFKKIHGTDYGHVIAIYDIAGLDNSRCLHTKNYGHILNDGHHNSSFLSKASSKYKARSIEKRAKIKLNKLKNSLAKLHNKYIIFSGAENDVIDFNEQEDEESIFDSLNENKSSYLKELHSIDKIARNIPVFFPLHSARMTSKFGMRNHPIDCCKKFHYGTDFAGTTNAPIYSAGYGVVTESKKTNGYGNTIVIDHGKFFQTRYAHLSKMFVKNGDKVIRGQKIALQGKTGRATSEHLHFEVIFKNRHLDPADFVFEDKVCAQVYINRTL